MKRGVTNAKETVLDCGHDCFWIILWPNTRKSYFGSGLYKSTFTLCTTRLSLHIYTTETDVSTNLKPIQNDDLD